MSVTRLDHKALGSRDIAQLVAVADSGSIRRAAEALGMTQPGLSKNIRLMEEKLGTGLFERSTSGAQLTEAGEMVLLRGRQVLLDLAAIQRDLHSAARGETGTARIGLGVLVAPLLATWIIAEMGSAFPEVTVHIEVQEPRDMVAAVETGGLDFAICNLDGVSMPNAIETRLLHVVDRPVFFARAGHPLAGHGNLLPERLAGFKMAVPPFPVRLLTWLSNLMGTSKCAIGLQVSDFEMIGELLEQSDMISFGSAEILATLQRRFDLAILPVGRLDYVHEVHTVLPHGRPLSLVAKRVLRVIETVLASMGQENGGMPSAAGTHAEARQP